MTKRLRNAINAELKKWLDSGEHLKTVELFGSVRSNVTPTDRRQALYQAVSQGRSRYTETLPPSHPGDQLRD